MLIAAWSLCVVPLRGQELERGFQTPPASARPRVWWHWMNGNITKEGIALDLDWMHRVGIVGYQNFDVTFDTPQVVDRRLVYMTPEWKDAFHFALEKADGLGFEVAVAGSPGWSESGGPWVKPQEGMKKLTWSETAIEGGKRFHGVPTPAPTATGPYGDLAQSDLMGQMGGGEHPRPPVNFGADVAVIAFREPSDEVSMAELKPVVTTSAGTALDASVLWDGDLNREVKFAASAAGEKSWIQFEFPAPRRIQGVTLAMGGPRDAFAIFGTEGGGGPMLESSDDGSTFDRIVTLPTAGAVQHTMEFSPVTARFFRLTFLEPMLKAGATPPASAPVHTIAELALHTGARVNRFEEKAGFAALQDLYFAGTPKVAAGSAIARKDVIDLTAKMGADGTLDWTPPEGRWTVLRMGYSLTGITNHPAPVEATGPEVDKLNRADVKSYLKHYLDNYEDASQGMMGKRALKYVITDSWEAGTQNWTDDMVAEFTQRRGYSPLPWMPVLAGYVVGSAAESDGFLWDFRHTISDLLAENHYGTITTELHARGLGHYGESHESSRATIGDGMEMKRADDIPMAAMWTQQPGVNKEQYGYNADIRESASVAHIYGQNLVAAESMTAGSNAWGWCPATLKPTADKELAMGLNRFVIHSSVHQPLVGKAPGLTLGPFGQWFNRNETWAEQAKPWMDYLSRGAYMMQQGHFVADVAYFYGEDSNLTAIFADKSPDMPRGYNFDYVNADVLEHKLSVHEKALVTDSGMKYRVLVLDGYSTHMSLPVLKRIAALVEDGATVIGKRPVDTPSLADDKAEFRRIADRLWGDSAADRVVGKGRAISGGEVEEELTRAGVKPDFTVSPGGPDTNVLFVHRRTSEADIYYVDNRNARAQTVEASFAVEGRAAELWHADTGKMEAASYSMTDGRTTVPLKLDAYGTVFVVFRGKTAKRSRVLPAVVETEQATLGGPWQVAFEAGRGAPAAVTFDGLRSWSENADAGIRYFAGHAMYTKHFDATAGMLKPGAETSIDLGDVANLAEVTLNGKSLGTAWKAPYRVDATDALKAGDNLLEVRVVDLWVNRLIGDQQPDAKVKYTFTTRNPYQASSPLLPSGLLGPVRIVRDEAARP